MATKLIEIKDAIWKGFTDDEDFSSWINGHGGHMYSFKGGDKLPREFSKVSLPAFVMLPASDDETHRLSGGTEDIFALRAELHVGDRDVDTLLDGVWYLKRAMKALYWKPGASTQLNLSYVAKVGVGRMQYDYHEDPEDLLRGLVWTAYRDIVVVFRDPKPS